MRRLGNAPSQLKHLFYRQARVFSGIPPHSIKYPAKIQIASFMNPICSSHFQLLGLPVTLIVNLPSTAYGVRVKSKNLPIIATHTCGALKETTPISAASYG